MTATPKTAAEEWRQYWTLVLAATLGVTWMTAPAVALGLFMVPLHDEFGWSFADISFGMTLYALVGTPLVPFAGALIDRFGSRRIGLPGLVLNGIVFAAFGLMTPSLWHWMAAWVLYTLTQLMIRSLLWNRAVSMAFQVSRGLALGVTMAGISIATTITPIILYPLIENYGWRQSYFIMGFGWAGVALVFAFLFLREPGDKPLPTDAGETRPAAAPGGLTLGQALRDSRIIRIVVAIVLLTSMFAGFSLHIFKLLTELRVPEAEAAVMYGSVGMATFAGQLITGWLADRVKSTILPVSCFLLPAIAYLLLLNGGGVEALLWLAVWLAGYGSGASINISTYLISRYGGMAHFGKIYGLISSGLGLGSGIGGYMAGKIFDATGSYDDYLIVASIGAAIAALAVFRLGDYPVFQPKAATA